VRFLGPWFHGTLGVDLRSVWTVIWTVLCGDEGRFNKEIVDSFEQNGIRTQSGDHVTVPNKIYRCNNVWCMCMSV